MIDDVTDARGLIDEQSDVGLMTDGQELLGDGMTDGVDQMEMNDDGLTDVLWELMV